MIIEEFWNSAFLAALSRVPPDEAKIEADRSTEICIAHWQSNVYNWAVEHPQRWQYQDIAAVPRLRPAEVSKGS